MRTSENLIRHSRKKLFGIESETRILANMWSPDRNERGKTEENTVIWTHKENGYKTDRDAGKTETTKPSRKAIEKIKRQLWLAITDKKNWLRKKPMNFLKKLKGRFFNQYTISHNITTETAFCNHSKERRHNLKLKKGNIHNIWNLWNIYTYINFTFSKYFANRNA